MDDRFNEALEQAATICDAEAERLSALFDEASACNKASGIENDDFVLCIRYRSETAQILATAIRSTKESQ